MRIALAVFVVVSAAASPAMAQVDQQRAAGFFKEAQALTWDMVANQTPRVRNEMFLHESFHIVQIERLALFVSTVSSEHLDSLEGRYWLRLEWRALARALRGSGEPRALAVREALAFRQARHARFPDKVESERALDINEGLASYTGTVVAAQSEAEAIARP